MKKRFPVEHYKIRIKDTESTMAKLERLGFSVTLEAAKAEWLQRYSSDPPNTCSNRGGGDFMQFIEVQIRTIAMDFCASLEHELRIQKAHLR